MARRRAAPRKGCNGAEVRIRVRVRDRVRVRVRGRDKVRVRVRVRVRVTLTLRLGGLAQRGTRLEAREHALASG